jgi:AcrR family transcriptional regulator
MGTPKKPAEERREEVVRAILQIVAEKGQAALSVSAVARRIGLVPSAIYRHFKNREAMVDGVVDYVADRLLRNVECADAQCQSETQRLHMLLRRHIALIRENPGLLRIVFSDQLFGGAPARRAVLNRMIQGYLRAVSRIIEEGQTRGEFRAEVDPQAAAVYFLGLIQPLAVLWHLTDGRIDITRMAESNWGFFLQSIAAQGTLPAERTGP